MFFRPSGSLRSTESLHKTWIPPPAGSLKINFDTAARDNQLAAAAVCRDSEGSIFSIRTAKSIGSNPLKGEARAARLALSLAATFPEQSIQIEGDALLLVN